MPSDDSNSKSVHVDVDGLSGGSKCTASPSDIDVATAWNSLVCNEGLNLINWMGQGLGNDLYWPPNQARDYTTESVVQGSLAYCKYLRAMGLTGIPTELDEEGFWIDTAYGGKRGLKYASNIFFSNGNLDPWAPAGVTPVTMGADAEELLHSKKRSAFNTTPNPDYFGKDGSIVSAIIDMGGHHLDLFWATEEDPASVVAVRQMEADHIRKWIKEAAAK